MTQQQTVHDGWKVMQWPNGDGSDAALVYTRSSGQFVKVGRANPQKLSLYLDGGYTFTPLVLMTPERIAALWQVVGLAQNDIDEGYARSKNMTETVELLVALLVELRGESDAA